MATADATKRFLEKLGDSLQSETFVRVRLTTPITAHLPERIQARLVDLNDGQRLSFTLSFPTRDDTKNLPVDEGLAWLEQLLGEQYQNAFLWTIRGDWQLSGAGDESARLVPHGASAAQLPSRAHDQARQQILDAKAQDWLCGLGVTNALGQVTSAMADKHRQINRYLEILSHLAADCGWRPGAQLSPDRPELTFVGMGCGKGYLTFGAWHLFRRLWQLPALVVGVEQRPELVESCAQLAGQLTADDLTFLAGTIQSAPLPPQIDALIALHACNTATDEAILRGIEKQAKLIVVAPCCHKEVRPQLASPEPLGPILRHGIMAERMAEWLTDGLRALYLEWAGYETKVFEFIASEHTPKNLMISAVRRTDRFINPNTREKIIRLQAHFGIKRHALERLLDSSWSGKA